MGVCAAFVPNEAGSGALDVPKLTHLCGDRARDIVVREVNDREIDQRVENLPRNGASQVIAWQVDGGDATESAIVTINWGIARVLAADAKPICNQAV